MYKSQNHILKKSSKKKNFVITKQRYEYESEVQFSLYNKKDMNKSISMIKMHVLLKFFARLAIQIDVIIHC